ncbi:hypothetical protein H4S02_003808 [Coemansia sp. RSA 2611]|nr:hypothetical protein H4S01_002278 [Coemansia sp. RSA 2610]KAJ2386535.1 hypothetical protein H4S02_003808 [Coemansia sp. RSA 2611]
MPVESSVTLRVGSRDSKLALAQTEIVIAQLKQAHPQLTIRLETMKTIGDKMQDTALSKIGDKGLFTKELESALAGNMIDVVVHSLKDMPTQLPENMQLGAISAREDPRDCVVMGPRHAGKRLEDLAAGSVVGTGSVRRVAQLRRQFPHLQFADVRGNLNTRLAKLDAGDSRFDALVLAAAGIQRLGMHARIAHALDSVLYAVGQGALGVEVRADDARTRELIECLNEPRARAACLAERRLMRELEGGCSVPIGVRTQWAAPGQLRLQAIVASPDGAQAVEAEASAELGAELDDGRALALGSRVAELMRERGADAILRAISH